MCSDRVSSPGLSLLNAQTSKYWLHSAVMSRNFSLSRFHYYNVLRYLAKLKVRTLRKHLKPTWVILFAAKGNFHFDLLTSLIQCHPTCQLALLFWTGVTKKQVDNLKFLLTNSMPLLGLFFVLAVQYFRLMLKSCRLHRTRLQK